MRMINASQSKKMVFMDVNEKSISFKSIAPPSGQRVWRNVWRVYLEI